MMSLRVLEYLAIDAAHRSERLGIPIASESKVAFAPEAMHHSELLSVNTQTIGKLMLQEGVEPGAFDHALYGFVPRKRGSDRGKLAMHSRACGGKVYYPYIEIALPTTIKKERTVRNLNTTMRHELRHTLQEDRVPLYDRPGSSSAVRLGAMAVAYNALSVPTDNVTEPLAYALAIGLPIVLATKAAITPEFISWRCDPNERDANIFAALTESFQPISYQFEDQT